MQPTSFTLYFQTPSPLHTVLCQLFSKDFSTPSHQTGKFAVFLSLSAHPLRCLRFFPKETHTPSHVVCAGELLFRLSLHSIQSKLGIFSRILLSQPSMRLLRDFSLSLRPSSAAVSCFFLKKLPLLSHKSRSCKVLFPTPPKSTSPSAIARFTTPLHSHPSSIGLPIFSSLSLSAHGT